MLPADFNWLDVAIAVFLLFSLAQGVRAGLIRSLFSIVGLIAGLTAALFYYARASEFLLSYITIPQFISDAVCFLVIFSVVSIAIHTVGSVIGIITRLSLLRLVDRLGGLAAGLVIGLAVAGVILILLTSFPLLSDFPEQVEGSYLAPPLIEKTHTTYTVLSEILPVDLPALAHYPEELNNYFSIINNRSEHSSIDFAELDGATCFVCGSPVQFLGYQDNQKNSVSPKFICTNCRRTSDGCQTYQGYHEMYERCPVILGNQGYRLDCGIWTNHSYHRPTGPCPVCGAN